MLVCVFLENMHFQSDFRWLCRSPWFLIYRLSTLVERVRSRWIDHQTVGIMFHRCHAPPGRAAHFAVEWGHHYYAMHSYVPDPNGKICKKAAQKSFSIFSYFPCTLAQNLTYKIQLLGGIFESIWVAADEGWCGGEGRCEWVRVCECLMSTFGAPRPGSSSISLYVNLNMCRYAHKIWTQPLV